MSQKNKKKLEENFHTDLEAWDLPVVVIVGNEVVQCNKSFVSLINFDKEMIVGFPFETHLAKFSTDDSNLQTIPVVLREAPAPQTVFLKPRGQSPVCTSMSIQTKKEKNREFQIASFSVINAEIDELQKNDIFRFREISKLWHVAVFDHNHKTNKIFMSPLYREIYGVETDDELSFENAGKFLHPDDINLDAVYKAHDPEGDGLFDLACRIIRPSGEIRWIHSRSQTFFDMVDGKKQAVRTTGAIVDFTDEYLLKKALEDNKQKLADILDSLTSIVLSVDSKGNILQWNKIAENISEIADSAPDERKLKDLFPMLTSIMGQIEKALADSDHLEIARIAFSNEKSISFYNVCVIPLHNTNEGQAVIRIDDVSEEIQIEQMLIQSEKLLSVGGLAAGMAHEINNPLAAIIQNAQVIQSRLSTDVEANYKAAESAGVSLDKVSAYVENRRILDMIASIREAGGRASAIVKNMLGFVHVSRNQYTSSNIPDLIDLTIELIMNDYDLKKNYGFHEVEILREYNGENLKVICDSGKIQQVILNLLKNSAQALFYAKVPSPKISIRVYRISENLVIEVEDNGPGIPDEISRRIFEPFFTTKPPGEGTGLGMSISYSIIVKEHKGKMHIQKGVQGGAIFIIELPGLE